MTIVPPRFGVCAEVPPAPETARSETAIAAAIASARVTSSQGESSASNPHRSTEPDDPPLDDAHQLVHLDAERGSPKYERAAMRWLERCLTEGTPRLQHFAEIVARLTERESNDA